MSWGKFFVITIGLLVFLWLLLCYAYGSFYLVDMVVPYPGTEIDEWLNGYYLTGAVSAVMGFVCAAIWFAMGNSYNGRSSLGIRYGIVWILSLLFSIGVYFLLMPEAQEGAGLSNVFVVVVAPLLYYLSSLFASPNAGKYIPPLSGVLH